MSAQHARQRRTESDAGKSAGPPLKRAHNDIVEQGSDASGQAGAAPRADAMSRAMLAMQDGLSSASWLIGTWTGSGKGAFPNMGGEEFYYSEEATFVPGRPFAYCMLTTCQTVSQHDSLLQLSGKLSMLSKSLPDFSNMTFCVSSLAVVGRSAIMYTQVQRLRPAPPSRPAPAHAKRTAVRASLRASHECVRESGRG